VAARMGGGGNHWSVDEAVYTGRKELDEQNTRGFGFLHSWRLTAASKHTYIDLRGCKIRIAWHAETR